MNKRIILMEKRVVSVFIILQNKSIHQCYRDSRWKTIVARQKKVGKYSNVDGLYLYSSGFSLKPISTANVYLLILFLNFKCSSMINNQWLYRLQTMTLPICLFCKCFATSKGLGFINMSLSIFSYRKELSKHALFGYSR